MITIYGNFLSRATRCLWMLKELGLPYENPQVSPQEAGQVAADLNLASVASLVDMVKVDTTAWPHFRAWLDACTGRPVWRKAHGV